MQHTSIHRPIGIANFQVFKKNGAMHRDVIKAFLEKKMVTTDDVVKESYTFEHNTYKLIVSDEILLELKEGKDEVYCLISFQIRTHGKYAIAIQYRPEKALKLGMKG